MEYYLPTMNVILNIILRDRILINLSSIVSFHMKRQCNNEISLSAIHHENMEMLQNLVQLL